MILYSVRRKNIKNYLKYKNKHFIKIFLIDVLYTPINKNLLSTIKLVRKSIKLYLEVILKSIILVKDNDIFEYIDIKNKLYFLKFLEENSNSKKR